MTKVAVAKNWNLTAVSGRYYSDPDNEPGGGTSPYPWYPALDLDSIPFHTASGAWGAQLAIQAPTAPTITRTANASNAAELEAEMGTPGTRVTITADITGGTVIDPAEITDVEVIIPNGRLVHVTWGGSGAGGYTTPTTWNRCRFTKASGDTIGGQIHQMALIGPDINDIIIDGLQLSSEASSTPNITPSSVDRLAIVNNRMNSNTNNFAYGSRHVVVAGNSCKHNSDEAVGAPVDGWGFRNGGSDYYDGPYVYFQNDIRGIGYFQLRFHPVTTASANPYYIYVADNTFVDRTTGQIFGFGDLPATELQSDRIDGVWLRDNRIYVDGSLSHTMTRTVGGGPICPYVRVNDNTIYGATSGLIDGGAEDGDTTGNTYNAAAGSAPAWGAAGDPTTIDVTP